MTIPKTPFKAFVSSTYEDLKEHRSYVITALRKAGIFVDPMEDWAADSDEPRRFSEDRLVGCHFCILLVAFRRGHVPDGGKLSITQLEYQAALDHGIDVLAYLLDEDSPWPRRFDELDRDPEVRAWRNRIEQRHGRKLFGLDPSSIEIGPAVTRWVDKQSEKAMRVGDDWVHLVSNFLGLPANDPETWRVAAGLLPHALTAVEREYARVRSDGLRDRELTPESVPSSQPTQALIAGAREYFEDEKARFERTCFVIMPFGTKIVDGREFDFDAVYKTIFEPAISAVRIPGPLGGLLVPYRAGTDFFSGEVAAETFKYLEFSRFAVADITGLNANVFYELGVRQRARPSGTAIFRQVGAPLPFDIDQVRTFSYESGTPVQVNASRALVTRVVEESLQSRVVDSPVHLALDAR